MSSTLLDRRGEPAAFRAALRDWLAATVPSDWEQRMSVAADEDVRDFQRWWLGELDKVGLATSHFPAEWGGKNLAIAEQQIVHEELARANAPNPTIFYNSLYQVPATLFRWGTREQVERYIPGVLAGDIWCLGFSEPDAGSDLAALRTRATRTSGPRGERYLVNGRKVWSSFAAFGSYYLLLARTDAGSSRHAGLSCLIVDLRSPGVRVRRIPQISGDREFCEVTLDEVEVPLDNRVGPEGRGWEVVQAPLSAERGLLIFGLAERLHRALERTLQAAHSEGWLEDDQWRRELLQAWAETQGLRALVRRMLAELETRGSSNLPSAIKLAYSEILQRFGELQLRTQGLDGQHPRPHYLAGGYPIGNPLYDYLSSWAFTISGGTSEIQRNIIAERVLGLPREPSPARPPAGISHAV